MTAKQWAAFCEVIGRREWGSPDVVHAQRHVLDPAVRRDLEHSTQAWANQRSSLDAAAELQAAGVPSGPVWSVSELIEADKRFDLRLFAAGRLGDGSPVIVPASPFEWRTAVPLQGDTRVHDIGEDSDAVFGMSMPEDL